jgi:hypothetical protein
VQGDDLVADEILSCLEGGGDLEGVDAVVGEEDGGCCPLAVYETLFGDLEPYGAIE